MEKWSRLAALVVSSAALLAMAAGLCGSLLAEDRPLDLPGPAVLPLDSLAGRAPGFGLLAMSCGIALLSLLPALRVLLACLLYLRARLGGRALVALLVLLLLAIGVGMTSSGGS